MQNIEFVTGDWKVLTERDKCNNRNFLKRYMKKHLNIVLELEDCSKIKLRRKR